jgi:uncharacterized membrane protein
MRIFGHPLHVMIVGPTEGLLVASALVDACYWFTGQAFWETACVWLLGCCLLLAGVAMMAGLLDLIQLMKKEAAKESSTKLKIANMHMLLMTSIMSLAAISFVLRLSNKEHGASIAASALLFAALILLPLGAWLGGELVLRHRVGTSEEK